jgi:hypothetical protein
MLPSDHIGWWGLFWLVRAGLMVLIGYGAAYLITGPDPSPLTSAPALDANNGGNNDPRSRIDRRHGDPGSHSGAGIR